MSPSMPNLRLGRAAWAALIALVTFAPSSAGALTYYVDNQSAACSNAGPGTEAQPYCTITAAAAAHNGPDVIIVVKPGIYREQVTVPGSGTAALPFVIQAQGPGVVIDGADDFSSPGQWVAAGGSEYRAAGVTWSPGQVFVDDARLIPSVAAPGALPVGEFVWVSGQGLYVNLGGANPGTHQTLVGRRSHGFNMFSKSWVVIEGFEVTRTEDRGIRLQNGCTDITVARNRVRFANSYGIHSVNGQRIVVEGNVVSESNLHGIGLTAGASGCVVSNNESFRNADPAVRRANGIHLFGAPGNTLFGNRVYENQDTGMQFSGGSNDCVAYNNRSWNNGDHGYDHLGSGGVQHIHDVAYGNYKDGFSFEGNSPNGRVFNCIGVENGITTDEFNLWVDDLSSLGFVSDYNIFWNSTVQPPIKYIATKYALLADYQAVSGQDAHSKQANPLFVNGAAGDLHLSPGSPAIDAADSGVPNWPATDADGTARADDPATPDGGAGPVAYADIGALEFLGTDNRPRVLSPSVVRVRPGTTVSFTVSAFDPDGDPIQSLIMEPIRMPANSGAVFTPDATNTGGTFTWDPTGFNGNFRVLFIASNALSDTSGTNIQVRGNGRPKGNTDLAEWTDEGLTGPALSGGFPNPSRGSIEFALDLPQAASVRWAVYDLQGRVVWSGQRALEAGRATLRWEGTTSAGEPARTGVYLVRAWVGDTQLTRRVVRF